jgi:hypothetical protein
MSIFCTISEGIRCSQSFLNVKWYIIQPISMLLTLVLILLILFICWAIVNFVDGVYDVKCRSCGIRLLFSLTFILRLVSILLDLSWLTSSCSPQEFFCCWGVLERGYTFCHPLSVWSWLNQAIYTNHQFQLPTIKYSALDTRFHQSFLQCLLAAVF